jgi:FkbM family methyltransferase
VRTHLVRALTRLGNPRLRVLRARAARQPLLRPLLRALESGAVTVPAGRGAGLRFYRRHLRIDHAHLGSIVYGLLEIPVQEALARHLPPGGVLYDVGANLGFFALLGARLAGPEGRVYAFEPVPETAQAIREHAELNRLANIEVIERAAGASRGRGQLQLVDDRSWSKLEAFGDHPSTERVVEVELVAIDELVGAGELAPPAVVKIDVEGAELEVLRGMAATLATHRPAVICELHGTQREFAAFMAQQGYRVINLEGPLAVEQDPAAEHALALPVTMS